MFVWSANRVKFLPQWQYWIQLGRPDFSVKLGGTSVSTLEYFELCNDTAARHPLWWSIDVLRQSKVRWRVRFWQHFNSINEILRQSQQCIQSATWEHSDSETANLSQGHKNLTTTANSMVDWTPARLLLALQQLYKKVKFAPKFPWLSSHFCIFPDFPWPFKFADLFQFLLTCRNPASK